MKAAGVDYRQIQEIMLLNDDGEIPDRTLAGTATENSLLGLNQNKTKSKGRISGGRI